MQYNEQISNTEAVKEPRHPHQEIVDLLAVALLRLRKADLEAKKLANIANKSLVRLGFPSQKSVNTNTDQKEGVC